ncbi:gliding motility-associated C-terminal domain-containing protein [Flavobacterium akiainvivens]|nr:gliding motility-associated C-terminal domain-containing protein [Flavobacterium akiainvivens]
MIVLSLFAIQLKGQAQVYQHDFGTTAISTHPYTVAPGIINQYLSGSSWANANNEWTSFSGSAGQAITMLETGGTKTITLSFNVATGRQLAVTGFNFWRQRSSAGAQNWSMAINGTTVGSGSIPASGAPLSTTDPVAVSTPINGLTGTINVVITLTGASGNGNVRLDDFALFGSVTQTCTPPVIATISPASGPANTVVTINGTGFQAGSGTSSVTFNGVAATAVTVVSDTQIKATVPANATTGTILVTTNNCEGITPAFTVLQSNCPIVTPPTDIFISELFDQDGGTPGAIELFNPTPNTITFNGEYVLERYGTIGDPDPSGGYILTLIGSIAPNSTYLLNSGDIPCGITPITGFGGGINANDEFKLKKNGVVIDVAQAPGEIGYTVIRNANAPVPSATFNAADWTFDSTEDCSNLGIHSINSSVSYEITSNPVNDTVCENNPDTATFSVTASNATGAAYQWKMLNASGVWVNVTNNTTYSGATTATLTITNAPASLNGTQFYCQVTLASCTLVSNAATLTVSPAPAVATIAAPVQPTCTTTTGTITVTAPLGTGLTYSINGTDFQTSPVFNVGPGSYFITVQNAAGCTSVTTTATVINPVPAAPAVATIGTPVQPTCTTATGTITVTAPLGTGLTYSINGTDFQTSPVFNVGPGSYFITVQNAAGCTSVTTTATVINPVPAAPAVAIIAAPVQPTCTTATGTITITAPLGTGLTYSINGTDFQTNPVFNVGPGSYFITVQNAAGCTSVTTTATIINPAPGAPAVATIAAPVQPTCTTATGTITVTAPLGTGLTYSINGTDFQTSPVFNVGPGSYFITVQNAAGCTSVTTTATVITPAPGAPAVATIATPVQPTCTTATGTITVTAPLGTGLTYSINGTDFQTSPVFNVSPGSYFITVQNAAGCTSVTTTATVISPAPGAPAVATIAAPVQPTCTTATGTITVTAPLGTGLTYSINGTDFQTSPVFNVTPGSYFITVQNAAGCTSVTTTATVINPAPGAPAVATAITTPVTCTAQGSLTINAPLGAEYTYSINGTDFQTATTFNNLEAGSYTVTVMTTGGCTSVSAPFTVADQGGVIAVAGAEGCEQTISGKHYMLHALPDNGSFNANDAAYEWFDANGNLVSEDSSFDVTEYANENQLDVEDFPLTFTVDVTVNGGCSGTAQFTVNGTFCDIPKGISPNNDGFNDRFDISGMNARKLSIFNRYGKEVYTQGNYTNQWHGQSDSGDLPTGTYYYVIELPGETKTGWVYINRQEN